MMACIGGHADVLKVLVEEFGMSPNISDFVSRSSHMQCSIRTYSQCMCITIRYYTFSEMGIYPVNQCALTICMFLLLSVYILLLLTSLGWKYSFPSCY